MTTKKQKTTGLTKSSGYQVGVRRTIPVTSKKVWDYLLSEEGMNIWLGKINLDRLGEGMTFKTKEGLKGEVRVLKPYSHVRLKWNPDGWNNGTTLQMRVIPNKSKATISFHQEHLTDQKQRSEMKAHWSNVLDKLSEKLSEE